MLPTDFCDDLPHISVALDIDLVNVVLVLLDNPMTPVPYFLTLLRVARLGIVLPTQAAPAQLEKNRMFELP